MMTESLQEHSKDLSILCVDDSRSVRTLLKGLLDGYFKNIYTANDGEEGYTYFREKEIDLIITDQYMPKLNGLDMIDKIRQINKKIPIILLTKMRNVDELTRAINLNVTHFVNKPFCAESFFNGIEKAIDTVVIDNLKRKYKQLQLATLKKEKQYYESEYEKTFKKEMHIIQNDYYFKTLKKYDDSNDKHLLYNIYYASKAILNGDTYSIRQIDKDTCFFFIVDAMGKGLQASISTLLSTAYLNHQLDRHKKMIKANFKLFLTKYIEYIKKWLMDDEIVSAIFCIYDLKNEKLKMASFSMPPPLGATYDGEIVKLARNNLPISPYLDDFKIVETDVGNIQKMLFFSDGLNESDVDEETLYAEHLKGDFKASKTRTEFINTLERKVKQFSDDVTIFYFSKSDLEEYKQTSFRINTRMSSIYNAIDFLEQYLNKKKIVMQDRDNIINAFSELLMNAYEHGNLNINSDQKNALILEGDYEDHLAEQEAICNKRIYISIYNIPSKINDYLYIKIRDEGEGFDSNVLKNLLYNNKQFNGRGIYMTKKMISSIYFSPKGNEVFISKAVNYEKE